MALNNKMMVTLAMMWLVVVTASLVEEVAGQANCLPACEDTCNNGFTIDPDCVKACMKRCPPNDKS